MPETPQRISLQRPILKVAVLQSSVRVLYMPAEGMPEFREIVGNSRCLTNVVGDGHFDAVALGDHLVMFCDRDELEASLGYSFTIEGHYIHGDAFFVRQSEEDYVSLTDDDVETILSLNI